MIRKTVFLTEAQLAKLEGLSLRDGLSMGEHFRRAVDAYKSPPKPKRKRSRNGS